MDELSFICREETMRLRSHPSKAQFLFSYLRPVSVPHCSCLKVIIRKITKHVNGNGNFNSQTVCGRLNTLSPLNGKLAVNRGSEDEIKEGTQSEDPVLHAVRCCGFLSEKMFDKKRSSLFCSFGLHVTDT